MPLSLTPLAPPDALLVVDGELPSEALLRHLAERVPTVIATDGAALHFRRATGRPPSTVVGDGDSLADAATLGAMEFVEMPDQERGDLEKALAWIESRGLRSLWMVGVTGKQPDHAFNNLSVLARLSARLRLVLLHDGWWGAVVSDESVSFAVPVGTRVSLLPLPRVELSTSGLRWELHSEALEFGVREGASNETVGPEVGIEVLRGALLLYVEADPPLAG